MKRLMDASGQRHMMNNDQKATDVSDTTAGKISIIWMTT